MLALTAGLWGLGAMQAGAQQKPPEPAKKAAAPGKRLRVVSIFQTPIEEPWDGAIHQALLRAQKELGVQYAWTEKVSGADFERVVREYAEKGYDLIMGDAFGQEQAARRVAKAYPKIKFLFGSGLGPAQPNFGVFDDWIHEPAYLCGMIAGKLTKSNVLGVVGGHPVPEVNRLINAFKEGAREVNPSVKVKVAFIGSWFDPPKAKEAALAQIEAGADLLYAERYGVIDAAKDRGKLAFGNLLDQQHLAPDTVITGPVWDMYPLVKFAVESVRRGTFVAMDYAEWTMVQKGGARLAPLRQWETRLPKDVVEMVKKREGEIMSGLFRAPVDESKPASD
ncbi:MAG: BMP family protein [Candidatus Rokubacteria bacterium]|nr:BMP family protein [Candidatus Rokubacteria bacterium]